MNEGPWFIFMAVVMYAILMTRLDRLGKQIESTSALIRYDIAPTEERRDDILKQWKQMQQQANTDDDGSGYFRHAPVLPHLFCTPSCTRAK
jgi:hypothetical protein